MPLKEDPITLVMARNVQLQSEGVPRPPDRRAFGGLYWSRSAALHPPNLQRNVPGMAPFCANHMRHFQIRHQ
jgi:hypothetical protein